MDLCLEEFRIFVPCECGGHICQDEHLKCEGCRQPVCMSDAHDYGEFGVWCRACMDQEFERPVERPTEFYYSGR